MSDPDKFDGFIAGCRRYGLWLALQRAVLNAVRHLLDFELCRVGHTNLQADPPDDPLPPGYSVRYVDGNDFKCLGAATLAEIPGTDYAWAFARGDYCIAALYHDQIVAWNFQTHQPTRVRPGLDFFFSDQFVYSYGSYTSVHHRGLRLSSACYRLPRRLRKALGITPMASTYYINAANLASRSTDGRTEYEDIFLGYALYVKTRKGFWCWRSPGCRRHDTGFRTG